MSASSVKGVVTLNIKPLLCALLLIFPSWQAHAQTSSIGDTTSGKNQVRNKAATELNTITVIGSGETEHEKAKNDVFEKDVSNVYADKEDIERYRGTSAGDLFKGLNGVYAGDSRNSGALDPNIRGIQGEGRIPLTVDGTEQATSVWLGPAGISNRNYIDPNMISSILVEKGVSATSGATGIGGSVQIRTLQVDDIVDEGETFGIELKAETATNSTKPNERAFGVFGKDYRDIPGTIFDRGGMNGVILGDHISPNRLPKAGDSGKKFNLQDHSYRLAVATKQEHFDLLAAYSYRSRGNYFSGKNGSDKYEHDTWQEQAQQDNVPSYNFPRVSYIAKYYRPGEEILNTSSELTSKLLKGTLRLPHDQSINLSFMRNEHTFGENVPWNVVWAIHALNGKEDAIAQNEIPYSQVKQDTWNFGYKWNPSDNPYINLTAGAWLTQHDSERHQNGDVIYGTQGDMRTGMDGPWDLYVQCHVRPNPPDWRCGNVSPVQPNKQPNDDGSFNIVPRAMQITDHRRTGFNLSNMATLHPKLDLQISADFTREKLKQKDASENLNHLTELTWGVNHMGPRAGTRQQWNLGINLDWRPTDWLQVNAGARYSDYWSYDDKLAEMRAKKDKNWAVSTELKGYNYKYRRLLTTDAEVAEFESDLTQKVHKSYQQYVEDWQFVMDYDPTMLESFFGHTTMMTEDMVLEDTFKRTKAYGNGYYYADESVYVPFGSNHRGFADSNPFTNGQIDASEIVHDVQGQTGPVNKYIASIVDRKPVYQSESEIKDKWEKPKKLKEHAWVPHIGVTAFVTDNIRLYARYNEFVRFPSLFESSLALSGSDKSSTGVAGRPEHAYNWEVGYVHDLSDYFDSLKYADIRINYFNNRIKDYIDRDWNFNIVQFSEKKLSGIELQARVDSGKYFANFGGTYRLKQQLCDKDYALTFNPIPGSIDGSHFPACMDGGFPRTFAKTGLQPEYSLNLDVGARLLEQKLHLGTRAVYHSAAKNSDEAVFGQTGFGLNRANYWNPILVFDAYASYQVQKNLNLDLAVSNLTNQYYLDPMARTSIPAPGRTVRVGLTARF